MPVGGGGISKGAARDAERVRVAAETSLWPLNQSVTPIFDDPLVRAVTKAKTMQLGISKPIRARWFQPRQASIGMIAVELVTGAYAVVPQSSLAKGWMRSPQRRSWSKFTLQSGGNFQMPVAMREAFAGSEVIRIDLGYGVIFATLAAAEALLREGRPEGI